MSRPSPTFASGLIDLFLAPASLFQALPHRRFWGWSAFALTASITAIAVFVFIGPMSSDWIVEQQLLQMGAQMSDQELAQIRPQLTAMAPHTATISAIGGACMSGLLIMLIGSAYMLLERIATRGPRHSWSQWLRLATWAQVPQLLYALGLVGLTLLASGPDQPMSQLGYASLNGLVLDLPPDHRWFNWASSLGLFQLWSIALGAIGIRVWTGTTWPRAAALAVAPWVLTFGVWALFV